MDFISNLPDEILLKIFRLLPFRNQFGVRRVNKKFSQFSDAALSTTTSFKLTMNQKPSSPNLSLKEDPGITLDAAGRFLNLCQKRLERMIFSNQAHDEKWVNLFANFHFPKLLHLQIGHTALKRETFEKLFRNCPNLKHFYWRAIDENTPLSRPLVYYPSDAENSKLEKLQLDFCDDILLFSFLRRCPNLRDLTIICTLSTSTMDALDEFLSATPRLSRIVVDGPRPGGFPVVWNLHNMQNLWKLSKLDFLDIRTNFDARTDSTKLFEKILSSFPLLTCVWLPMLPISSACFEALIALEHLQTVGLKYNGADDIGLRRLAGRDRLQEMLLNGFAMSPTTLLDVLASGPNLRFLRFDHISAITNTDEAIGLIGSVSATFKINVSIDVKCPRAKDIWWSDEVKVALNALKEGTMAHDIRFVSIN